MRRAERRRVSRPPVTLIGVEHDAVPHADGAVDPLWCLVLDGFHPDLERVREALLTLA